MNVEEFGIRNREWWKKHVESIMDYRANHASTFEEEKKTVKPLQALASSYVRAAFYLLVGDTFDLAHLLLDHAIEVAHEALRTESFNRNRPIKYVAQRPEGSLLPPGPGEAFVEDESYVPSAKQLAYERAAGMCIVTEELHYALWFRSGSRPIDLWLEAARHYENCLKLVSPGACRRSFESLMMRSAEAGEFGTVIELYRKYCRQALTSKPKSLHFARSSAHVLFLLSEYLHGRDEFEPLARYGVEHQYEPCLEWFTPYSDLHWKLRLSWAYLRGKHFTGITEIQGLIHELRGY